MKWLVAIMLVLPGHSDVILDWNVAFLAALRNETAPPTLASRNLAILHLSIFDAVNSVAKEFTPYKFQIDGYESASPEAAAVSAAHEASVALYPSQRSTFDALYERGLKGLNDEPALKAGVELGRKVAKRVLDWRAGDGASTMLPYIPGNALGDWRRTPPFFRPPESVHWAKVLPFAIKEASAFRPPKPPTFDSEHWVADYNKVKELGGEKSRERTEEQSAIAVFWSDFSYTVTPPGHWNQIAEQSAKTAGNSLLENARLFALLNVALADAGVACWDAKFAYNFWRPVTAIQKGEADRNEATTADPEWLPLLVSPSFPEYVSGHSTFSMAAAEVLVFFFETDRMTFTVGSDSQPGTRTYHSFRETAAEVGVSRIYGGIHFPSANEHGKALGARIAEHVTKNYLQPRR